MPFRSNFLRAARRFPDCCLRQQAGGIQRWQWRGFRRNQQRNLCASQDYRVAALIRQGPDYFLKISERTRGKLRIDQFVHDDLVDPLTFFRAGNTIFETCGLQLFRIYRPFHQILCAQYAQPLEVTSTSLIRDLLRNVQPGTRRAALDQIERLVNGVVGTNEEFGTCFASFSADESISSATPGQLLA